MAKQTIKKPVESIEKADVAEKTKNPVSDTNILHVTVDTQWLEVLHYDQTEGLKLVFEVQPDKWIGDLTVSQYSSLSRATQLNYIESKKIAEFYAEEFSSEMKDDRDWLNDLYVGSQSDSATAQLSIIGGKPDKHYYWESPDRLGRPLRMGYKPCVDKSVITVGKQKDGTHKIMKLGNVELVLLEIDKAARDKIKAAEKVERLKKTYGKNAKSDFDSPEMLNQAELERVLNIRS